MEVHPIAIRGTVPESEGFRVDGIVFPTVRYFPSLCLPPLWSQTLKLGQGSGTVMAPGRSFMKAPDDNSVSMRHSSDLQLFSLTMSWTFYCLQSRKYKGTDVVAVTSVQRVVDNNGRLDFQPNLTEETQQTPFEQLVSLTSTTYNAEYWHRHHSFLVYHRTLAGGS